MSTRNLACRLLTAFAVFALACSAAWAQNQLPGCVSPDKQIELTARTVKDSSGLNSLVYSIQYRGKPVIADSRLGIDPVNQTPLGLDTAIVDSTASSGEDNYRLLSGKISAVEDHYCSLRVQTQEPAGLQRKLDVEFRVFNDGVAFRYLVPLQPALRELRIERETTEFQLSREGTAWPLLLAGFRTSYEDNYVALPLSAIKSDALVALPFLVQVPGVAWVAITEADLDNYAGMYLKRNGDNVLTMVAQLAPRADDPEIAVIRQTPANSPWRVIQIAPEPAKLIESNIVRSLNPPSRIADASWIHPGKTSWTWWSGDMATGVNFKPGMNTPTIKYFIEFLGRSGVALRAHR